MLGKFHSRLSCYLKVPPFNLLYITKQGLQKITAEQRFSLTWVLGNSLFSHHIDRDKQELVGVRGRVYQRYIDCVCACKKRLLKWTSAVKMLNIKH